MLSVETAIHQGDALELMRDIPSANVDLVFADPPFNIGYEYDSYDDEKSDEAYLDWSRNWMEEVHRLLTPSGTFWLAIGDEYAADLKVMAEREIGFTSRSWVVWYYTFGVNCVRKFSRSHAHLFHFVKDPDSFTFNSDDPQVRVPSARALVYGDKRANPKGRLPDDTWILRPQDFQSDPYGFDPLDDTWYFSRVAGTFKERQGFHGCQMPEQLLGRIIRVSSNPGDLVFDPFVGSGTTLAVAKKLGRRWMGCELSEQYVLRATERLDEVEEGDRLDGPANPIASAPTTAAGRRLRGQPLLPLFKEEDFTEATVVESIADDVSAQEEPLQASADATQPPAAVSPRETPTPSPRPDVRQLQDEVLMASLVTATGGHSIERLLADPGLQDEFHRACSEEGLLGTPVLWNQRLLELRKEGKLPKDTGSKTTRITAAELDPFQFAAEIAWRITLEKFGDLTLSDIFSSPERARFFDRTASRYAPGFLPALYRRAALVLRKTRASLVAEAKLYDYVLKTRDFGPLGRLTTRAAKSLEGVGGVYLLVGARQKLYIGESLDLGTRLAVHADAPATRGKVTQFATIREEELPSSKYRSLLKIWLVGRYQPQWNIVS
jgi:DNA modification methylase